MCDFGSFIFGEMAKKISQFEFPYPRSRTGKYQLRRKTTDKAIGRTGVRLNTKIHAVVDGLGNPAEFLLLSGNGRASVYAIALLEKIQICGSMRYLTDCAYSARALRSCISEPEASYLISPLSKVSEPWPVDWRPYVKPGTSSLSFVCLAAISVLLLCTRPTIFQTRPARIVPQKQTEAPRPATRRLSSLFSPCSSRVYFFRRLTYSRMISVEYSTPRRPALMHRS